MMKYLFLLISILILTTGCDKETPSNLQELEKSIALIADNPNEAFYELMKLKIHKAFLSEGNHPYVDEFDITARTREIQKFKENFDRNDIPKNGYLAKGTVATEKIGIFEILRRANEKRHKTRPKLRMSDGFSPTYGWIVLYVQKCAPFYWYKIILLLNNEQENEAIRYLTDYVNAELLTDAPTIRTINFIISLNGKRHFSTENKRIMEKLKNTLHARIDDIKRLNKGA